MTVTHRLLAGVWMISLHHGLIWSNFHTVLSELGVSKTELFGGVSAVLAGGLAVMIAPAPTGELA